MEARRELIEAVGERYRQAGRVEKKQILDEFAKLAGYHRKHVIRVLSTEGRAKNDCRTPDRTIYGQAVIEVLTIIWEAVDRICGKRWKSVLPTFVASMELSNDLFNEG